MKVLLCPVCGFTAPPFMDESYTCESGHEPAHLEYREIEDPPEGPFRPTHML